MAWTSLASRLSSLPLLLCGPIVRRAETSNVSVWFVLKENRNVTFNIYSSNSGGSTVISGSRSSGVKIGDHVFVYCVTATGGTLSPGTNYFYDIDFGSGTTLSSLISSGLDLTYDGSSRPSFALPPDNLNQVRLIHGSCRKPHGEGYDAMEGVHEMILTAVSGTSINAINRPHQLFLTGDQIYADDVADVLLFMIDDAASALFGWDENYTPFTADELKPGKRNTNNRLLNDVGFTGMLPNKPQYSKSHLLKFREYATMYLFTWSEILWPGNADLPSYDNVHPTAYQEVWTMIDDQEITIREPIFSYFNSEHYHIRNFKSTISKVRKALANISTYMIYDDHEITDDWNLNWRWCKEVYSKPLGRRTVQNGLLAFALFQAWGNTPDQFNEPIKGFLLDAANAWRGADDSHFALIKSLLNIPTITSSASIASFPHHSGVIFNWYYNYQSNSYAVYVQDSRTWRSYPSGRSDIAFANLISQAGYSNQLPSTFPNKEIILIIAPCPVLGEPFIEEQQHQKSTWEDRCDLDTEAWSLDQYSFQNLFSNLASRLPVVGSGTSRQRTGRFAFLSGDVHYGLSSRCQVWGSNNFLNDSLSGVTTNALFAQLTASSFRNQTAGYSGVFALIKNGTLTLHNSGYQISVLAAAIGVEALPRPSLNFAWIIGSNPTVGRFRPGILSGLWDYGPVASGLLLRSKEQLEDDHLEIITVNPNWRYRIDWILGASTGTDPRRMATPNRITVPPSPGSRAVALQNYLAMTRDHGSYTRDWGTGKEIVGVNTLGEIRFSFSGTNKQINHIMWWRMNPISGSSPLQLFPLTTFTIPVNFSGDKNHDSQPYSQPTFNGL